VSFLHIENLGIRLGEFCLRDVSFSVDRGEYLVIMGPTGAGKTILLECIVGFHRPEQGRILVDGRDITRDPPEKRRIGIVYQDYALLPHLNVFKNIEYGLKKVEKDKEVRKAKVRDMAAFLHIDHLFTRKTTTLSGGEQQRTALARALVVEPRVLLLDEPLSALDPMTRLNIRRLLGRIIERKKVTVLHVTHDMDDAWSLARKTLILDHGRVMQHDTLNRVMTRPANAFVGEFVGATLVTGEYRKNGDGYGAVRLGQIVLQTADQAPDGGRVTVAIRPERVMVSREMPGNGSGRNVLKARLCSVRHCGLVSFLDFQARDTHIPAMMTTSSVLSMGLEPDTESFLSIAADNVKIIQQS
jgi:molybdate transport system ATP-binding protein